MARERSQEYVNRRAKCLSEGICLRCSNPRDGKYQLCAACREKKKAKRNNLEDKRRKAGLCRCGKSSPVEGFTLCAGCLEALRKSESRQRDKNRAAGMCLACGGETVNNEVTCKRCQERAARRTLERYAENISTGVCPFCGEEKPDEQFRCEKCHGKHLERGAIRWERDRNLVISQYGGKCQCCGETTNSFLELDHVNNDGNEHRKEIGRHIYRWAINNQFPDTLQILCANCNRGRGKFGICPHAAIPSWPKSSAAIRDRKRRLNAIAHYGGKCKCGEDCWAFLEFDHIDNDGSQHRLELGSKRIVNWIIENNFPTTIQLLCSNCNMAKARRQPIKYSVQT